MWLKGRQANTETTGARRELPLAELPDTLLVREAKGGNAPAYTELVGRYQDRVFSLVLGQIQSREDATDLTQEVFLRAYQKLSLYREGAAFYTWLYRIAVNACIDFRRKRAQVPEPFSLDNDLRAEMGYELPDERSHFSPEHALEQEELRRYLRQCIQALPEVLRVAVLLHDVEGLPQKEIAGILKCPLGTVKSRIQRGRIELREKLKPFLLAHQEVL